MAAPVGGIKKYLNSQFVPHSPGLMTCQLNDRRACTILPRAPKITTINISSASLGLWPCEGQIMTARITRIAERTKRYTVIIIFVQRSLLNDGTTSGLLAVDACASSSGFFFSSIRFFPFEGNEPALTPLGVVVNLIRPNTLLSPNYLEREFITWCWAGFTTSFQLHSKC